jgi:hypothetical protein
VLPHITDDFAEATSAHFNTSSKQASKDWLVLFVKINTRIPKETRR